MAQHGTRCNCACPVTEVTKSLLDTPANVSTAGATRAGLPTHVLAAIRRQVGAGDPAGLVGNEKRDRVRNFLRAAEASGRDLRDDLVAYFLRHRHHHVGSDVTRRYGI